MKKLIVIIGTIFILYSCESNYISEGRTNYKSYLSQILNDPKSLDILSEKFTVSKDKMTVYWTIDYTAKNQIGGVVRNTEYFVTLGKDYIKAFDNEIEFSSFIETDNAISNETNTVTVNVDTTAKIESTVDTTK